MKQNGASGAAEGMSNKWERSKNQQIGSSETERSRIEGGKVKRDRLMTNVMKENHETRFSFLLFVERDIFHFSQGRCACSQKGKLVFHLKIA